MRAADPGFQHPATPDRNLLLPANVVNLARFGEAADPADFDIDNAAGSGFQSNRRRASADDGLVEAKRSAQFSLQAGMIENVIVPERLLNHQQVELIEGPQVF